LPTAWKLPTDSKTFTLMQKTFMQQALALAAQSLLITSPNPRVGR
jgi:pyrimidine deaminase RibD-like protein